MERLELLHVPGMYVDKDSGWSRLLVAENDKMQKLNLEEIPSPKKATSAISPRNQTDMAKAQSHRNQWVKDIKLEGN